MLLKKKNIADKSANLLICNLHRYQIKVVSTAIFLQFDNEMACPDETFNGLHEEKKKHDINNE